MYPVFIDHVGNQKWENKVILNVSTLYMTFFTQGKILIAAVVDFIANITLSISRERHESSNNF